MLGKLGSFIFEEKVGDEIFYVRGLTVGEYTELVMRGILNSDIIPTRSYENEIFTEIALSGIVGWKDVYRGSNGEYDTDEYGVPIQVAFDEEMVQYLPHEVLNELGRRIFMNHTQPSKEESDKFRGYIRFSFFLGDDDNKAQEKYFNCSECLKASQYRHKLCGLTGEERDYIRLLNDIKDDEKKSEKTDRMKDAVSKRKTRKRSRNTNQKVVKPKEVKSFYKLGGFDFPECPVTYIDPWITVLAQKLYYCETNAITFFSGGLIDQPNKLFELGRITKSEANAIEIERMERDRKKTK